MVLVVLFLQLHNRNEVIGQVRLLIVEVCATSLMIL